MEEEGEEEEEEEEEVDDDDKTVAVLSRFAVTVSETLQVSKGL